MEKIKSTYSTACCVVHTARESITCSTANDTDFQYSFSLSLYHLLFENKHESTTHLSFRSTTWKPTLLKSANIKSLKTVEKREGKNGRIIL